MKNSKRHRRSRPGKKSSIIDSEAIEAGCDSDKEEDLDDTIEMSPRHYTFNKNHPGFDFSYLQRRKLTVVPVVSLPVESFCCIKDLEIHSKSPSAGDITKQEIYTKMTSLLSLRKFRSVDDLKGNCISYWQQFLNVQTSSDGFWQDGMNVLLNIDHRLTAQ